MTDDTTPSASDPDFDIRSLSAEPSTDTKSTVHAAVEEALAASAGGETAADVTSIANYQGVNFVPGDGDEPGEVHVLVNEKQPPTSLSDADLIPNSIDLFGNEVAIDVVEVGDLQRPDPQNLLLDIARFLPPFLQKVILRGYRYYRQAKQLSKDLLAKWTYGFPPIDRQTRHRPVVPSVSVGHIDITAGTLGAILEREDGTLVGLTNAHVAAPHKADPEAGDTIVQPGPRDAAIQDSSKNRIGSLAEWSPITTGEDEVNHTDSALFEFDEDVKAISTHMPGLGRYDGGLIPKPGDDIPIGGIDLDPPTDREFMKVGRTTDERHGLVVEESARTRINYRRESPATFEGVTLFEDMSAGGDSGSVIGYRATDENGDPAFYITHLLFAGSDTVTIAVPFEQVIEEHGDLSLPEPEN